MLTIVNTILQQLTISFLHKSQIDFESLAAFTLIMTAPSLAEKGYSYLEKDLVYIFTL